MKSTPDLRTALHFIRGGDLTDGKAVLTAVRSDNSNDSERVDATYTKSAHKLDRYNILLLM